MNATALSDEQPLIERGVCLAQPGSGAHTGFGWLPFGRMNACGSCSAGGPCRADLCQAIGCRASLIASPDEFLGIGVSIAASRSLIPDLRSLTPALEAH